MLHEVKVETELPAYKPSIKDIINMRCLLTLNSKKGTTIRNFQLMNKEIVLIGLTDQA